MRPRPHRPIRELRRALTALGLTVAVFAMPLWTVSVHAPDAELFTPAPAEQHRVASFVMTLPPEPVPPSEPEPVPEPDVEPEPAPSPTALTEVAPPPVPEPAVPRAEPPRDAPASARVPPPPSVRLSTAGSGRKRRKKRNCQPGQNHRHPQVAILAVQNLPHYQGFKDIHCPSPVIVVTKISARPRRRVSPSLAKVSRSIFL